MNINLSTKTKRYIIGFVFILIIWWGFFGGGFFRDLGSIFTGGIVPFIILGCIGFIVFRVIHNRKKNKKIIEEYNKIIFDQFNALGSTKEEREKNIKKLFDEKKGTIHFQWHYKHSKKYRNGEGDWITDHSYYKRIGLKRNLALMNPRERDLLRIVFLLFNESVITRNNYCYYLFAFVYSNGQAAITHHDSKVYPKLGETKDNISAQSVAKYIMDKWDASVGSATNRLLHILENIDNKHINEIKNRIQGNDIWLSDNELRETIFSSNGNHELILGQLENSTTSINYSGEGSLITIAPPASGKTQCFVIPNMLNWKGAAVVLDIKGDIYEATSHWRERNVGKVFKFSPLEPNKSNSYNPLDFVRDAPDYIWEDSRFLADMMIVPSGAQDPFWENMARDVLTAAIAHITFDNDENERSMSKVLDIIYGIGWDEMITSLKTNVLVSSMKRMGNALDEIEKKQRDSILKTAQSSLSAWQGERIAKVTNKSDWSPLDLRNGAPTIYICINPNEIDSYLSLIRVFIAQHIRMLTSELPDRNSAPVLFMLDELPRLKKMPPVDEALNIGRQYGIKLWMFAQSYGQLKEAYPDPEGLVGSCAIRTFMNLPLNDEFTTKISDQLGYKRETLDKGREKLVEPIELAGPNYKDLILVLASGTKPAKVKKKFAYEDQVMISKMKGQIEL